MYKVNINELPRGMAPRYQMEFLFSDPEGRGTEFTSSAKPIKPLSSRPPRAYAEASAQA